MSTSKTLLFEHIKYLGFASELPAVIDDGIALSEHNGAANLLRKGLGIVAFNVLEDFIKNKTLEALEHISNSGIIFSNLTDKLQEASIWGALGALKFRAGMLKKQGGDWKELIQEEALKIHSTKNSNFELSKFSFVSGNSNISVGEVPDLLKAFAIGGGWSKLKEISDKINGGVPDLSQAYGNAAQRRHKSAHSAAFRYEYQWLANIKNEILAIAASIDIILSARCRQVDNNLTKEMKLHSIDDALNFRFLESNSGRYRETTIVGGRARKNWSDLDDALADLKPKLKTRKEFLIVLDSSKRIENWYC